MALAVAVAAVATVTAMVMAMRDTSPLISSYGTDPFTIFHQFYDNLQAVELNLLKV